MSQATVESDKPSVWRTTKSDFLSSIVVFLVALPLCMGIAIASGVPVAAGLITGMVGGLVVGFIAGSPLQVSGPAAGLTVLVYELVREHGLPALGIVVLIAGVIQIAAGLLKLGQWFRAVSPAVIHGMLSGIGVLIFASQFHVMVDDRPRENGVQNLLTLPEAVAKGLPLPEFSSVEHRQMRMRHLKSFGHLHEKQQEIEELVAERVSVAGSEALHREQAGLLVLLAPMQETLIEQLREHITELDDLSGIEPDNARLERIHLAAIEALAAAEAALADLSEGRFDQAEQSQQAAVVAVETILAEMKDHQWAAKIGLLTILIIVAWQMLAPKRIKLIPAPLVAVTVATILAAVLYLPVLYVEVPDNLVDGIHLPSMNVFRDIAFTELLLAGLMIAVVASAETLLCATAVDQMHTGPRTRYDRELLAQGVGNSLCGLLGALPMTGVIVRSAANVQAGAKTRLSAILHGLWLLVFVVAFGFLLTMIPTACLAGILVYTGYKLVNPKTVIELWRYGKSEVAIYLVTVVTIVVEDLLIGVITGVVLSALKLLILFSYLRTRLDVDAEERTAVLSIEGAATFLRLPILAAELERVPASYELHVDFERLDFIDHACLDLLVNWARQHESTGGRLVIDWESLHARFGNGTNPRADSSVLPRPRRERVRQ